MSTPWELPLPGSRSMNLLSKSKSSNARRNIRSIHKLNDCLHFHYPSVELAPIDVQLIEVDENSSLVGKAKCVILVKSNGAAWKIDRTLLELFEFDRQLHRCVFERRHSKLEELECMCDNADCRQTLSSYCNRLSQLTGSIITCYPVLKFLEVDSRGNHFCPAEQSGINTPAIASALVTKDFQGTGPEQLNIRAGDILSTIEMSSSTQNGPTWWKAKLTISATRGHDRGDDNGSCQVFQIGYFPSDCVTIFDDKSIPIASPVANKRIPLSPAKRVRNILSRKVRRKEPIFGVDLSTHLSKTGREVPLILERCVEAIEKHGIVTGIYRQCGIQSNIQRLRAKFDCGHEPDLNEFAIVRDIYSVSSLLKQYFRQLPNPLFTFELYNQLLEAHEARSDVEKIEQLQIVLEKMPPSHYCTARFLLTHLHYLCEQKDLTDMTARNLAIVWAPNLFKAPPSLVDSDSHFLNGLNVHTALCNFMILHSNELFTNLFEENHMPENVCPSGFDGYQLVDNGVLRSSANTLSEETITEEEKNDSRWSRFIRGTSVEHILGGLSRRRTMHTPREGSSEEKVKWRRSQSTDAAFRSNRSESLLSIMAKGAEGLRDGVRQLRSRARSMKPQNLYKEEPSPRSFRNGRPTTIMQESITMSTKSHISMEREQSESKSPKANRRSSNTNGVDESTADNPLPGSSLPKKAVNFKMHVMEHSANRPLCERSSPVEEWSSDESRASSIYLEMSRYDNVSPAREYKNLINREGSFGRRSNAALFL